MQLIKIKSIYTMVKLQKEMIKGLDWFRSQNSKAYMTLLD